MKKLLFLALIFSSFNILAKCPEVTDAELSTDQLIVKNLLNQAYLYQTTGLSNTALLDFTSELKNEYTSAAEFLTIGEISAFITEQDSDDNICPNQEYPSSSVLKSLVADKIIETYYGCGCEH